MSRTLGELSQCAEYNPPSIPAQLVNQKKDLEKRLAEVNEAIEILEKNPELGKLLSIVRRNC